MDTVSVEFPTSLVILAGDFNMLSDTDVISKTSLNNIVDQPTRCSSSLDRIYVNDMCYSNVKVVTSAVKSDHKSLTHQITHQTRPNHPGMARPLRSLNRIVQKYRPIILFLNRVRLLLKQFSVVDVTV